MIGVGLFWLALLVSRGSLCAPCPPGVGGSDPMLEEMNWRAACGHAVVLESAPTPGGPWSVAPGRPLNVCRGDVVQAKASRWLRARRVR